MDFNKQQAVVTAEAKKYDEKKLLKVLEDKGYKGKVLKNGAKN